MSGEPSTSPADAIAGALALLGAGAFAIGRRRAAGRPATDDEQPALDDDLELTLAKDDNGVYRV